jgi:hypothetical protein
VPPAPGAGATGMVPSGMAPSAAALAALTTLPATPSSYVQPLMPTMGGLLLQSTYGEFELWTGGRPLYDWTGLDSTWVTKSKSPNQRCPTSSSGAKKKPQLQKGLTTMFDRGSDLSVFQTALLAEEAPGYRHGHHYVHVASQGSEGHGQCSPVLCKFLA